MIAAILRRRWAGLRPLPALLRRWIAVARQRRALAALDPCGLRDIGLSPAQAWAEARRPFWDLPRDHAVSDRRHSFPDRRRKAAPPCRKFIGAPPHS